MGFTWDEPCCLQATIMTDPGMADRTYIGPMTPDYAEQILAKVRDGLLDGLHRPSLTCPCPAPLQPAPGLA